MNIFVNDSKITNKVNIEGFTFVFDLNKADKYEYNQFIFLNNFISIKTIYIDDKNNIYCFNINLFNKVYKNYFFIGNLNDENISFKIEYFFHNLSGISLHTLSQLSNLVKVVIPKKVKKTLSLEDFIKNDSLPFDKNFNILIKSSTILSPQNLIITDSITKLYNHFTSKLDKITYFNNIFFDDFVLSLVPEKYWVNSLFFINSKLKFKVFNFYNNYDDIITLHIPIARSKYAKDLFESLLYQTNKNFKICMGVDGYNEKQKEQIVKIIKKYENKFTNFSYFVNKTNLGVGKTRRKLLNNDKFSRYVVFLDDDNFLSENAIDFIYKSIKKYPNMGIYSIENIDVRFDINFREYVSNLGPFSQPGVYTNRERVNRIPLYCNQEETPLIHDRYYSDLLSIKYNEVFNKNSIDMTFNRFLEIICGNINLKGAYQFMRVGHKYHQTRELGYEYVVFNIVMFLLKNISKINNNTFYYTYLVKTLIPKQNELFTNN